MDLLSELLEDMATTSIALNRAIADKVEGDIERGLLLTEVNAIDYQIHIVRKHLENLNREHPQ